MEVHEQMKKCSEEAYSASSGHRDQAAEQGNAIVEAIVAAAQSGCPVAFEKLHVMYSGRLYRTILSITRNSHDAEEALQDTFLRAFLAIKTFEGKSTVYTWLTRIAVNSALMVLRKRRSHREVSFDPQPGDQLEATTFDVKDSAPSPEEVCELTQRQHRTLRAIGCLRPYLRRPLRMQVTRGWSIREISQALKVSEASVKSRLYRARQQLASSPTAFGSARPQSQLTNQARMDQ